MQLRVFSGAFYKSRDSQGQVNLPYQHAAFPLTSGPFSTDKIAICSTSEVGDQKQRVKGRVLSTPCEQHSRHNTATAHSKHYTAGRTEHLDTRMFLKAATNQNTSAIKKAKLLKWRRLSLIYRLPHRTVCSLLS